MPPSVFPVETRSNCRETRVHSLRLSVGLGKLTQMLTLISVPTPRLIYSLLVPSYDSAVPVCESIHTHTHTHTHIYIYIYTYTQAFGLPRQWHPTPVLLPGESHGRRSLVGCSSWGLEESDMTERLHFHFLTASATCCCCCC